MLVSGFKPDHTFIVLGKREKPRHLSGPCELHQLLVTVTLACLRSLPLPLRALSLSVPKMALLDSTRIIHGAPPDAHNLGDQGRIAAVACSSMPRTLTHVVVQGVGSKKNAMRS